MIQPKKVGAELEEFGSRSRKEIACSSKIEQEGIDAVLRAMIGVVLEGVAN